MNAAEAMTTTKMLATDLRPVRKMSGAEPVASPMASSTMGRIKGAISIAPITTAVLSSANPSVARAAAISN
ncbi:MAG: hypothetical protein M4D80_15925 [Myxococcota bacterium]|nr:hypothetical protein [Myxococcota bacterium]